MSDNDGSENATLRRGLRVDLVIAVCALLMSSLATAASWWQSRIIAEQLSSQVWPYLSISTTLTPDAVALDVINDGLGPAIVRSAVLSVDGKPYRTPTGALLALVPSLRGHFVHADFSSLSPGAVIRVSGDVKVVHVTSPWAAKRIARASSRFDITVCYCSLLGNCWITSAQSVGDPRPVARCPDAGRNQLTVPIGM